MNRYLTTEKLAILKLWEEKKKQSIPRGDLAGKGWPDPDIIPWCDKLNEIEGLCTLQSCAGHGNKMSNGELHVKSKGILWIWLSESMNKAFYGNVFNSLAKHELMERVRILFSDWGQEIIELSFKGNECNCLDKSINVILNFFKGLENGKKKKT